MLIRMGTPTHTVYLDNNATTKVDERVFERMRPYLCESYGNPSSLYPLGLEARKAVSTAREQVAGLIGARPSEIVFTACGTESDNTAIMNVVKLSSVPGRIVSTRVEHLAVLRALERAEACGWKVDLVGVDGEGRLDMDTYAQALEKKPALVTMMWANNETGALFPIGRCSEMARDAGALFHTDAVQAAGKITLDVSALPVDMLSLSGHKLHAPKGVGALFVREGIALEPFLVGGHQEGNRRAGTENVASIVAFGYASELAATNVSTDMSDVERLRDQLQRRILDEVEDARVIAGAVSRTPNTLNIAFPYLEEDAILEGLSSAGICASSGSACNSRTMEPSHVLSAMGVDSAYINGAIRFSLSRFSTQADIDYTVRVLSDVVHTLREESLWDGETP